VRIAAVVAVAVVTAVAGVAAAVVVTAVAAADEEEIEVVPVPLSQLPSLIDRVRDAKTLVGLLRVARALGI